MGERVPSGSTVYLDYQATTPVDPRVLEAMIPFFTQEFGNAASQHVMGNRADSAVKQARRAVAALIGAGVGEIIFTSGATESINLALKGFASGSGRAVATGHIVTTQVEHKAVLDSCRALEKQGCLVTYVAPDPTGRVGPDEIMAAIRDDTFLVAVIWANNEVGTINPIEEIAHVCRDRGVALFTDATQAVGKIPVDVNEVDVEMLCLSGHKIYGPKGVGALYVNQRGSNLRLTAQIHGGGHERGLRSGTLNVPGVVGLGAACELCREEMASDAKRMAALRDRFEARVRARCSGVWLNGCRENRLPNCLNLGFEGADSEAVLANLPDVAISSGSACTSAVPAPSHVLRAMGVDNDRAASSVRVGFGRFTTDDEIDYGVDRLIEVVERIRRLTGWLAGEEE